MWEMERMRFHMFCGQYFCLLFRQISACLSEWVHIWERECEKIERNYQLSEFSSAYFFLSVFQYTLFVLL